MTYRSVPTRSLTDLPSHHICPFRSWDRVRGPQTQTLVLITVVSTSTHRQPSLLSSSTALGVSSGGSLRGYAVIGSAIELSGDQHRPDNAGHLGGICHRRNLERAPLQQITHPRILGASRTLIAQIRGGTDGQQRAQRAIALLGDTARALLAAGAKLARCEPQPRGKIACRFEHARIRHRCQ